MNNTIFKRPHFDLMMGEYSSGKVNKTPINIISRCKLSKKVIEKTIRLVKRKNNQSLRRQNYIDSSDKIIIIPPKQKWSNKLYTELFNLFK
jgi:hypothetical protein